MFISKQNLQDATNKALELQKIYDDTYVKSGGDQAIYDRLKVHFNDYIEDSLDILDKAQSNEDKYCILDKEFIHTTKHILIEYTRIVEEYNLLQKGLS